MRVLKDESVLLLLVISLTVEAYPQLRRSPEFHLGPPWSAAGSSYSRYHSQEPASEFHFSHNPQARKIKDGARFGEEHQDNRNVFPSAQKEGKNKGGSPADRWRDESYTVIDEKHLEPVNPHILPFTTHIQYVPVAEIIDKPVISSVKVEHRHPSGSHVSYETREYRPHQVAIKLASDKAPQIHETLKESIISQVVETNPHVYKIPIIQQKQSIEPQQIEFVGQSESVQEAASHKEQEIPEANVQASDYEPPISLQVRQHQPWPAAPSEDLASTKDNVPASQGAHKVANKIKEVFMPPDRHEPPSLTEIPDDLLYGKQSVVSQAFYDVQRQVAPPYVEHKRYLGPYPFQTLPGGGRQLRLTAPSHVFDRTYYGKTHPTVTYMFPDRLYRS